MGVQMLLKRIMFTIYYFRSENCIIPDGFSFIKFDMTFRTYLTTPPTLTINVLSQFKLL